MLSKLLDVIKRVSGEYRLTDLLARRENEQSISHLKLLEAAVSPELRATIAPHLNRSIQALEFINSIGYLAEEAMAGTPVQTIYLGKKKKAAKKA